MNNKTTYIPGSYGGDPNKLKDDSILECKICWYVYEPSKGDDYWQIEPNTPFSCLPDYWTCPECDAGKTDFLVVDNTDV